MHTGLLGEGIPALPIKQSTWLRPAVARGVAELRDRRLLGLALVFVVVQLSTRQCMLWAGIDMRWANMYMSTIASTMQACASVGISAWMLFFVKGVID